MRLLAALLLGAIVAATSPQPAAPAARLTEEIERARAALEAAAPADERAAPVARLGRATAALDAGRLYLAAYLSESGWEAARNWTFIKASSAITTEDAFLKKWSALGEPRVAAPPRGPRRPAVVDALAAVAEGRAITTYQASRPYGQDSGVSGGLYYLADSRAVVEFGAMVRRLDWPAAPPPPAFRSLAAEITALDAEMVSAYEKMERANHPTYISASAALKQARTLDERGQYGGALVQYLLSRYQFAALRGPAREPATAERIAAARAALPATVDHSIAELFLQLADEGVSSSVEAQRRGAAAALEDVLPAYTAAIAPPRAMTTAAAAAAVTVTLVRWPYT